MIVRKIVVDDGRGKRDVALAGTITVGRDPSCQISDPDPLLSRRHAEFVATAHEVTIRDLGSRNGVLVNGAKVPERVLVPGDLVQIGRLHCLYVEETAAAMALPRPVAPPAVIYDRTIALAPPADALDELVTPLGPLPTGNELTFVPAGWREQAIQGFDDTQPGQEPPDVDATRVRASFTPDDLDDVTTSISGIDFEALAREAGEDETTMAPRGGRSRQAAPAPLADGQARIVTGPGLIVSEASAAGSGLFGMSPQSLVGASIPDLVVRALGLMVAGEGPAAVSLVVERRASDGHVTMTFTAPLPSEE